MAEPKTAAELAPIVGALLTQHRAERPRLDRIARYMSNRSQDIYIPRDASSEFRHLVDQARFNVLPIVVTAVAQNLYVEGYRPQRQAKNAAIWDSVWQPNRLDARQAAFYRSAIRNGWSYATVLPGSPAPVITPWSARRLTAIYDDPVNDEWPRAAMTVQRRLSSVAEDPDTIGGDPLGVPSVDEGVVIHVYEAEYRYRLVYRRGAWAVDRNAVERHGLPVVPVVRFVDAIGEDDLEWDRLGGATPVAPGKVEPLLPAQRQLNQTTYGLLMAQHYAAFRQRWVTGMIREGDDQDTGAADQPWNARADAVWHAESPDTKFGEFDQTDLKGYLDSRDKVLLYISTVAQIPPHDILIGPGISNISAEALAALEAGHRHDIQEHQHTFGESVEQMLRLAGLAAGSAEAWEDTSSTVKWADTTPRSLAQVADALGKLAQQLAIPPQALWERIPGATDQDLATWRAMAAELDLSTQLGSLLEETPAQAAAPPAAPADALAGSNGRNGSA